MVQHRDDELTRSASRQSSSGGGGDVESYADRKVAHVATFGALFVGEDAGLSRRASRPHAGGAMAESVSNRARTVLCDHVANGAL